MERRVTKIRNILEPREVHYVKSNENPADPASRGLTADQLSSSTLWFLGPSWLQNDELPVTDWPEKTQAFASESWEHEDIFAKYSSWWRVLRVAAHCLRIKFSRETVYLNASEIRRAKLAVIRYYQSRHLSDVIEKLMNGKTVHKRHWLHRLSPFLDSNNIIRIGGRLGNATSISESQRNPIVIPKGHLTNILVRFIYLSNEHASNSLMLRLIIEEFWIPGIRNVIQQCIRRCPI